MAQAAETDGKLLLSPYRVIDLTDERGLLCGKLLADLGADVIQVEPPGGSTARKIGPFYKDETEPEKSLFWWAYAANKRGITLDLHTAGGRDTLRTLVKDADFLIESYSPGYLDGLGLGYRDLEAINPGLVMVSITPFGKDGPYAHYASPDLVGMAMGGLMYVTGDSDRAPLRVGFPQFYLHGGGAGAAAAMIAHTHRVLTGEGQHVDVSCQQALAKTLAHAPQSWDLEEVIIKRMGPYRQTSADTRIRLTWRCKDGYVNYMPQGGGVGVSRSTRALLAWMDEEGMGDKYVESVKWEELGYGQVRSEVMERVVVPLEKFFATHTIDELVQASLDRRIFLFPVATQKAILNHTQLAARDYFDRLYHPELDATITYPGVFIKEGGGGRAELRRRPPLIGEHNDDVYRGEPRHTSDQTGDPQRSRVVTTPRRALEGIKVLDFSWVAIGPMTTKYLAEYGATVIRVESAKRPESLRRAAPFKDGIAGINRSGYFANYNANKYGITIDARHPRARDLVLRIASWADLVVENFTPGTMESWGLAYDDLREVNPGIVMFSTSMLGRGGPMERQPGFGPVLSSLAGLTHITGWPDRNPSNPYGAYTDFIAPRFAIAAILAALDYRRRTGEGIYLDMSQLETGVHFSAPFILDCEVNGRERGRVGNRDPDAAPHGVYPCKGEDRWIAIACTGDDQWSALCRSMDSSGRGWSYDGRFSTLEGRKACEDELDLNIAEWTKEWDSRELMEMLQAAGVPAGMVNDCHDLFDDPQLKHRNHFQYLTHPEIGRYATDRSEWDFSRTPGRLEHPSPLMGEHTEYVLREMIGLSEDEYRSLEADGALE